MFDHSKWVLNDFVQIEEFFVNFETLVLHLGKVEQVKHKVSHHLCCMLDSLNPFEGFVNFFPNPFNVV